MQDPFKESDFLNYELQLFLLEFLAYRSLRPANMAQVAMKQIYF